MRNAQQPDVEAGPTRCLSRLALKEPARRGDDLIVLTRARDEYAAWQRRRRAGARARRKYAELRKAWLRAHRWGWLGATAFAVLLCIGFWVLMRGFPGDQSWATAAFAGSLATTIVMFRRTPPNAIATWEEGAWGEEETAKALRVLEREGWVVLHDLVHGSRNFDHVVLGPTGVYCLNSKWSGYRLESTDDGRLVGRHRYDEEIYRDVSASIRAAKGEASELHKRILARTGHNLWVQPVVVWWGEVANGGRTVDGVGVVQGKNLADRLRAQKGRRIRDREAIVDALTPGRHTRR